MGRVWGMMSALALRIVSRSWAVELCHGHQPRTWWVPDSLRQPKTYCSVCTTPPETVTYQELKQLLASNNIFVIDVRESWELKEYGQIPGSINVPLGHMEQALQLDPKDFMEHYGGKMPTTSDKIVFSCLGGVRSKKALDMAADLGYSRAVHYPGGWEEWENRESTKKNG
ncbi:thiosulfate sulfurtransferase/rhodanese-like domain-containing protein 3 [Narcine bancroftii]|uniref:thiosulfate sulfurtransferase/rhodanese-like domain-containing protein 3 n=1 Tax=Narcine bancroftii TaxID=1343680 RepID=UPI00383195C5